MSFYYSYEVVKCVFVKHRFFCKVRCFLNLTLQFTCVCFSHLVINRRWDGITFWCVCFLLCFYKSNPTLFIIWIQPFFVREFYSSSFTQGNWSSVLCCENFRLHTLTCSKLCCLDKNPASFPSVPMKSMVGSHPCRTLWIIIVSSPFSKATAKWIPGDLKFTCAIVQCICVLSIVTQFEGGRGREVGS